MRYANKKQITIATESLRTVIAMICIIAIAFTGIVYAATEESRKLLNGSFEEGQTLQATFHSLIRALFPHGIQRLLRVKLSYSEAIKALI